MILVVKENSPIFTKLDMDMCHPAVSHGRRGGHRGTVICHGCSAEDGKQLKHKQATNDSRMKNAG